ncbi:MAG: MG2 domain-containing protein, partial [Aeoliella sp.]
MLLVAVAALLALGAADIGSSQSSQAELQRLMKDGNYKEALAGFRQRLQSTDTNSKELARDLGQAVQCLRQLNQVTEFDAIVESAVDVHSANWRLLSAAAAQYRSIEHYGYLISGKFERGQHRGGGKVMHATDRDGVRSLQLLMQALELAEADANKNDAARVARQLAETLLHGRGGQGGWRLQALTDLAVLPDYEEGWGYSGGGRGAPVDADNKPVFYTQPASWDDATSDGERWRWALGRMAELNPGLRHHELTARADFLRSQCGVITLGGYIEPLISRTDADDSTEASIYTLHTLKENETLARLATGIQRLELRDEHNFVLLYQQAYNLGKKVGNKGQAAQSATQLARLFADRRQYPRSAEYWRIVLEHSMNDNQKKNAKQQIDQIEKPWGQFEQGELQPAGEGASFEYRFRNGDRVEFTAHAIKVSQLLTDLKAYLESQPQELDWNRLQIEQLGYRLVHQHDKKFVGEEVAKWNVDLEPPTEHFDRRETVTSPLQKAGAYLVTAKMSGGNTAKIVLWVADTAILKKPLGEKSLYYVADAVTGKPIEKAHLELFGYKYERPKPNQMRVDILRAAEYTDVDGQAIVEIDDAKEHNRYQWLSMATTPQGRLAYLGFHHVWRAGRSGGRPESVQTFAITDRPVYRPGQKVNYKLWIERAKYDGPEESEFAHKAFQIEIFDPKGEKVHTAQLTANAYGGVAGEWELAAGATLGHYRFHLVNYGGGSFRVEEYKKPEFEVTIDAPDEPLALGDKFDATITARYYFGEPVREGTVKYKVSRTSRDAQWFPAARWDWLYGSGYWWFGNNYDWYPGWGRWGCRSPYPWWIWRQPQPPEIVAEGESPLGNDGTVSITIDSALAKELHPDEDHDYSIEAEVVDRSRRTIVGSGSVLVTRKPFEVFAWTDRGFYRTGDTVTASFQARRPDGKPVAGSGKLRLLSITYPADTPDKPVETEVRSWDLATQSDGTAEMQIKASEPGQYRLSYEVTGGGKEEAEDEQEKDDHKHTIEGGYFFTIVGAGFDGSDFRFNDLELVPDKRQYAPGDKVLLQVNTNRRGGTVLLYVRPENGVYSKPRMIRLKGKSTTLELDIAQGDMPNFFIEAQAVSNGKVHTVAKQVVVPPEERVINVEVAPSSTAYQPGQEASVKVRLTDETGEPVVGDTVLTVYDKSLEYISGGSNVGDIRQTFWSWKRNHQPATEHNLERYTGNLVPPGQQGMQTLGAFGFVVGVEESKDQGLLRDEGRARRRSGRLSFSASNEAMPMDAAPMSEIEMDAEGMEDSFHSVASETASSGEAAEVAPTVRKEFADTAYWAASVETGSDGLA